MQEFSYDDLEPLNLNEDQPQLCRILYDEDYKQVMGLLLALMAKNEYSERALALNEQAIDFLASHYSIWIYRFDLVKNLNRDLIEELNWCEAIALDNEKNYQIWNYRQLIIDEILATKPQFDPHRELPLIEAMLDSDCKNHHVWSYRKWLVSKFDLYDDEKELNSINLYLMQDIRNNSAWSHRFMLMFSKTNDYQSAATKINQEIEFCQQMIRKCPQNPSSWNYLRGIYEKYKLDLSNLQSFTEEFVDLENIVEDNSNNCVRSTFALELLGQINQINKNFQKSIDIYNLLAKTFDPIRYNYWQFQISKIEA